MDFCYRHHLYTCDDFADHFAKQAISVNVAKPDRFSPQNPACSILRWRRVSEAEAKQLGDEQQQDTHVTLQLGQHPLPYCDVWWMDSAELPPGALRNYPLGYQNAGDQRARSGMLIGGAGNVAHQHLRAGQFQPQHQNSPAGGRERGDAQQHFARRQGQSTAFREHEGYGAESREEVRQSHSAVYQFDHGLSHPGQQLMPRSTFHDQPAAPRGDFVPQSGGLDRLRPLGEMPGGREIDDADFYGWD